MSRKDREKRKRRKTRRARLFAKHFHSQERVRFIKSLPCEITKLRSSEVVNAHMKSRAAGGTYADIVPLSWRAHYDFDVIGGAAFEKKWGRSKQSIRAQAPYYESLWEAYDQT